MFKQNHILPRCIACYISLLIGGRLSIITDCTPSAHRHAWCQCSVASHRVRLGDTSRFTRTAYWCCKYKRLSHLAPELCTELNNKTPFWPKVKVERTALHISKTNRNSGPEDDVTTFAVAYLCLPQIHQHMLCKYNTFTAQWIYCLLILWCDGWLSLCM